jgi:3-hydroxyacyl-CoA dehydrogenase/enoyl-CoA hydratase/3-hydroxybutyryl-CoA epimerase
MLLGAVEAIVAGEVGRESPGFKVRALQSERARALAARRMRGETEKKAPQEHDPAPHALIDMWERRYDDRNAMQAADIESFAQSLDTEPSEYLRRAVFLSRGLKENARGEAGIAHVHVVGLLRLVRRPAAPADRGRGARRPDGPTDPADA